MCADDRVTVCLHPAGLTDEGTVVWGQAGRWMGQVPGVTPKNEVSLLMRLPRASVASLSQVAARGGGGIHRGLQVRRTAGLGLAPLRPLGSRPRGARPAEHSELGRAGSAPGPGPLGCGTMFHEDHSRGAAFPLSTHQCILPRHTPPRILFAWVKQTTPLWDLRSQLLVKVSVGRFQAWCWYRQSSGLTALSTAWGSVGQGCSQALGASMQLCPVSGLSV